MSSAVQWNVMDVLNEAPIAVIILNQPISCSQTLLSLWERALIRITVDGGSNRWRSFVQALPPDVKPPSAPHCITGDFDSITKETETFYRDLGVQFIPTPDQDETDFTKALRIVSKFEETLGQKIDFVFCVCEHSGRLDQTLANLETLHHVRNWTVNWRPILLSHDSLTWILPVGKHIINVDSTIVSSGLPCGLIPLKGPATVTTHGLKWDLDQGVLQFGTLVSTSNTYNRTSIEVETSSDLVWTMQYKSNLE